MNYIRILLFVLGTALLGGCATDDSNPPATEPHVQLGMSREELKTNFGPPVRIEPITGGGEDWIYHFTVWKTEQSNTSETSQDFDGKTTTSAVSWQFGKDTVEQPVHISNEGFVIKPLPKGKIVKN